MKFIQSDLFLVILLWHSSQESEPSPEGLLALLALGVHLSDFTLAEAAVTELKKFKDKQGFIADVSFAGTVIHALKVSTTGL